MLSSARLQTIVCTARMAEASRFYEDILGLRCTSMSHGARVYNVGGAELRLSPVPSMEPSTHTVVGFAIKDLDAVIESLLAHGVTLERFSGFPHDSCGTVTLPDHTRVAWFRDLDGNLLSIVQYAQAQRAPAPP